MKHPHTSIILSGLSIPLVLKCAAKTLKIVLVTVISSTTSFLLQNDCPVNGPCTCLPEHVQCQFKQLKSIPAFKNSSAILMHTLFLNFTGNFISAIPANTFSLLKTVSAYSKDIQLLLSDNKLTDTAIDEYAFNDIDDMISYLDLRQNNLSSVPKAVSKLQNLKELYLAYNPIRIVDPQIFTLTGQSLQRLSMPLALILSWPEAFHHLSVLEHLTLIDLRFTLPPNAFQGFTTTLKHLILHRAEFPYVPPPVCDLKALQTLNITNDSNLIGKNIGNCNPAIATLQSPDSP